MLRTGLSLLLLCSSIVLPAAGQDKSDATASLLRSLEKKWADAYKQRQVWILASLLADDYVITVEDGSTYGKLGYMSHSAARSSCVDIAEFTEMKVRIHGD